MKRDLVWENKKYIRYSLDWYNWLLGVMQKRNVDNIWVAFSKTKFGQFTTQGINTQIRCIEKQ